ncbi:MAG: 50S ribosomal protein L11 methyltransferase [Clostridia bacterium]|nr:50S ribosomal protein L11 methyltransferase [Clostridia bacterium]
MGWIEITVSTNTQGADIVSEALRRQGAAGTQIIDRSDVPDPSKPNGYWELIDPAMIEEMPENVQVKAWFETVEALRGLENILAVLPEMTGLDLGTLQVTRQGVQEQDWSECWKQYYKPFRAGKHLVIKPSWETWDAGPEDRIIELDPGMAFGTGTHETTAMCVEMIEKHYRSGSVLDVGTGSGILAIAAARLGARSVLGVDIDPMAVKVARENVEKNGLTDVIDIREGDLVKGLDNVKCDFAVANILADVIALLAGPLKKHLTPNAVFVCSGILKEREEDVRRVLSDQGYTLFDRLQKGDWVALAARAEG